MKIVYDIIFILFSLAYLPYLFITGRYHKDLSQRFGFYPKEIVDSLKRESIIWVHAVSVGEVMAARTLCERFLEMYPEMRLVISTITKTGNSVANRLFKDRATVLYLPVDISHILNKTFNAITPEIFVIIETEIWPNLILALSGRKIPIFLVNGRISPSSYKGYKKIRFAFRSILSKVTLFCMQNDEYADRIKDMGAPEDRVAVTGNMKFDAVVIREMSDKLNKKALRDKLSLTEDQPLFIAGSTHKPEEKIILSVYKDLVRDFPRLRLLLAPRHIERTREIEAIAGRLGFKTLRVSDIATEKDKQSPERSPVLILDTIGRLSKLFSIGTIVFVGGSLMKRGGQNILEPAAFSKPIVFGPYMFNFKDIAETFIKEDAAIMVKDRDELFKVARFFLGDEEKRKELGDKARSLVDRNIGATDRNMYYISKML